MDGIISVNNQKSKGLNKIILIILTALTAFLVCVFAFKRLTINYANIYPSNRSTGIEHSLQYSILTIGFSILLLFLICSFFIKIKSKKQVIITLCIGCTILIGIICSSFFALSIPESNEYLSKSVDNSQLKFFPIDKYKYNENSSDFYFYKEVRIRDIYWIGSCSYKDFASENSFVDLIEEISDSKVFMNYYYLKDATGKKIKEYEKNKNLYDLFSSYEYISEFDQENYSVYEYEDSYEFILMDDNEVFYLAASKNKRTQYDVDDIISISTEMLNNLETNTLAGQAKQ